MQDAAPNDPIKPPFNPDTIDYSTIFNTAASHSSSSAVDHTAWPIPHCAEPRTASASAAPTAAIPDPAVATATTTTANASNCSSPPVTPPAGVHGPTVELPGRDGTGVVGGAAQRLAASPVSIRAVFDASSPPLRSCVDVVGPISFLSSGSGSGSPQASTKPTAAEEEMVRRIHRKVGGPAKLSTFEEPAVVRRVVIDALASEQPGPADADRVRRGQLSASERRVVRTVTNRGAAVRSRMRQRREMATLRQQVRARDGRVRQLEAVVRALCSAYAVPLPQAVTCPEPDLDVDINADLDNDGEWTSPNVKIRANQNASAYDRYVHDRQLQYQQQQHHHHHQQRLGSVPPMATPSAPIHHQQHQHEYGQNTLPQLQQQQQQQQHVTANGTIKTTRPYNPETHTTTPVYPATAVQESRIPYPAHAAATRRESRPTAACTGEARDYSPTVSGPMGSCGQDVSRGDTLIESEGMKNGDGNLNGALGTENTSMHASY